MSGSANYQSASARSQELYMPDVVDIPSNATSIVAYASLDAKISYRFAIAPTAISIL